MKRRRQLIFLKDVFFVSLLAFGGPHAHYVLFQKTLVTKRRYATEDELLELYTFCQLLPGPSSTQTITGLGYRIGGWPLALLTLVIWALPACAVMTFAAIVVHYQGQEALSSSVVKYMQAIAVAFVFYAAFLLVKKSAVTKTSVVLIISSALICFLAQTPVAFPIIILLGGMTTTFRYKEQKTEEKQPFDVRWGNLIAYAMIFIGAAILGKVTGLLPIRLFENFYRNGSLIFGGGQALIGMFYTEFVEFKSSYQYMTSEEFLSGFAMLHLLPGPLFSFSSYIGALAMRQADWGVWGMIMGGAIGMVGIFLPSSLWFFFLIRVWEYVKRYRIVKASKEGLMASSAGIILGTAFMLGVPMFEAEHVPTTMAILVMTVSFVLLAFTKVRPPLIILAGLILGWLF
jgi:chromate transporter